MTQNEWEIEARTMFRSALQRQHMTLDDVAARLGCSRSAAERWSAGHRRIPAWVLIAVSREAV